MITVDYLYLLWRIGDAQEGRNEAVIELLDIYTSLNEQERSIPAPLLAWHRQIVEKLKGTYSPDQRPDTQQKQFANCFGFSGSSAKPARIDKDFKIFLKIRKIMNARNVQSDKAIELLLDAEPDLTKSEGSIEGLKAIYKKMNGSKRIRSEYPAE